MDADEPSEPVIPFGSSVSQPPFPQRGLGVDRGCFVVPEDFDDPLPAWFMRYFE
jgi:hypothetical protein